MNDCSERSGWGLICLPVPGPWGPNWLHCPSVEHQYSLGWFWYFMLCVSCDLLLLLLSHFASSYTLFLWLSKLMLYDYSTMIYPVTDDICLGFIVLFAYEYRTKNTHTHTRTQARTHAHIHSPTHTLFEMETSKLFSTNEHLVQNIGFSEYMGLCYLFFKKKM